MNSFPSNNAKDYILIKGAKTHNLKSLDVAIPKKKFVAITGLSGSGKSSLAFDTLFAEGQRRYVESLSAYARQFLGRMQKPEVEYIKGIAPAIAIEQKVNTTNPRSTVGTSTEIYDYLKLLYSRVGRTYSPISNKEVKRHSVKDVLDYCKSLPHESTLMIGAEIIPENKRKLEDELQLLLQKGYSRVLIDNQVERIDELLQAPKRVKSLKSIDIIIDRIITSEDEEGDGRISDSVQSAFFEGRGKCFVLLNDKKQFFSNLFEEDGMQFEKPSVNFFSFNNPYGACKTCEGFGSVIGIDEDLVIPNKTLSVYEDAIAPWRGEVMSNWKNNLVKNAMKVDFPVHRAYNDLNLKEKDMLWNGSKFFKGLNEFFAELEANTYKIQYRVMLARYRGKTPCKECKGTRLRKDATYVKVADKSLDELVLMPIHILYDFMKDLPLKKNDAELAKRILFEIRNRLLFLVDVGLGYLTLNRLSNSLSGGESQRINLANSLGSSLVGSLYILDEPSIGLHSRDTERLIVVLKALQTTGNTVIVVEHDEDIIRASEHIIDIGPGAGSLGGELVFEGNFDDLLKSDASLTGQYLSGKQEIAVPKHRRKWNNRLYIKGASENNLKEVDVTIPIGVFTAVTGVSGSGKSSLIRKILYPAVQKAIGQFNPEKTGNFAGLEGDIKLIQQVEMVDQNPIGKSSRSNPVTYIKAYDDIRNLFAEQRSAQQNRFKPSHFSFNVDGGRCDTCKGDGVVKIEMQFMADLFLTCETCNGQRFKPEVLEVTWNDKNISEVLKLTVADAMNFFESEPKIVQKIKPLYDVGLGYIGLGQASNTLSGGEAQRIKLASFISRGSNHQHTLFIFDEPTTGLHFHDIHKLLDAFHALIELGNTIVVIEHNLDVIKCADWLIDLGPEGGELGGNLIFEGVPEDLISEKTSFTGKYLKDKIKL